MPLQMFRLRAGFYVTRDGNFRIVRRTQYMGKFRQWCVERWTPSEQRWERLTERHSLTLAREFLELEEALQWWREGL